MSLSNRVLLPAGVKPIVYHLELTPDLDNFTFKGFLQIELLVSSNNLNSIVLHSKVLLSEFSK